MGSVLLSAPFESNFQLLLDTNAVNISAYDLLDNDELIESCFRNYHMFLSDTHELNHMYALFRVEIYQRLALRGLSNDEAEYLLRSGRFVDFAKKILFNTDNESLTNPPSASRTGDDVNHVCA